MRLSWESDGEPAGPVPSGPRCIMQVNEPREGK